MCRGKTAQSIHCARRAAIIAGAWLAVTSATFAAEQDWPVLRPTVEDVDADAFPEAPTTSFVVPAPDGALAGLSVLTGLAIAYAIRHHRARRAR